MVIGMAISTVYPVAEGLYSRRSYRPEQGVEVRPLTFLTGLWEDS
jgi:hypothetical protein